MNNNLLVTCLLICLVFPTVYSAYVPNRKVPLPDNVFEIDYSPQQAYLAAASKQTFVLYSGHTGKELQRISIDSTISLTSFGFSQDNNYLALGKNNGTVTIYEYNADTKKFVDKYYYESDVQSDVTGICFSPDSNFMVIGLKSDRVIVADLNTLIAVEDNFDG